MAAAAAVECGRVFRLIRILVKKKKKKNVLSFDYYDYLRHCSTTKQRLNFTSFESITIIGCFKYDFLDFLDRKH